MSSTSSVATLSSAEVRALTTAVLREYSSSQLGLLSSTNIVGLTSTQVRALSSTQIPFLSSNALPGLTSGAVAALGSAQVRLLSSAQLGVLSSSQIAALSTAGVLGLSSTQLASLGTASLRAMETRDVAALRSGQLAGLGTAQVVALDVGQVAALGSAQLGGMSAAQLGALTTAQLAVLGSGALRGLGSAQLGLLGATQLQALSTVQFGALTTGQLRGLSSAQVQSLGTSQIVALTSGQLKSLSTAMSAAFSSSQLSYLSTQQIRAIFITPLVLDLDGGGVSTRGLAEGVSFDIDGDGVLDRTGWIAAGEGLLALDRNLDGEVNDGTELFGSATRLPDGTTAIDGFRALASLDTNGDGWVDASDSRFAELKVWVDSNLNGKTEPGELRGVSELGVSRLSLAAKASQRESEGNFIGLVSAFEGPDGQSRELADVWFQVSASERFDEQAAHLGGELKAYQPDGARDSGLRSPNDTTSGEGRLDVPSLPQAIAHVLRSYGDRFLSGPEPANEASGAVVPRSAAHAKPQTVPGLGAVPPDSGGLGGGSGGAGDD